MKGRTIYVIYNKGLISRLMKIVVIENGGRLGAAFRATHGIRELGQVFGVLGFNNLWKVLTQALREVTRIGEKLAVVESTCS